MMRLQSPVINARPATTTTPSYRDDGVVVHDYSASNTESSLPQHSMQLSSSRRRGSFTNNKSKSIPIDGALRRSPSEEQLLVDEAIADERDYKFCCRVAQGISKSIEKNRMKDLNEKKLNPSWYYENSACLNHVLQTRNDNVGSLLRLSYLNDDKVDSKVDYGYFHEPQRDAMLPPPPPLPWEQATTTTARCTTGTEKLLPQYYSNEECYDDSIFDMEL